MSHYRAKKRFGQNFLKSENIINSIIEAINPQADIPIIEIGAGRGALTYPLAGSNAKIIAIEFDNDLIGYLTKLLSKHNNVDIVHIDFLLYKPTVSNYTLVGNLPYNITTPVVEWACERYKEIHSAYFMTQKEVALRLASTPGSRDWSPLAIFSQLYFDVKVLFDISPKHFSPPPKVTSSLIQMIPKKSIEMEHPKDFERLVRQAFKQRRKTLVNNLVPHISDDPASVKEILSQCELPENIRAEQISTEKFLSLTNLFAERKILTYKKN